MDEKKFLANFAKILGAESTFEELEQKRLKEERMLASLSKSLGAEDILEDIKKKEDQLIENMSVTLSKYQVAEQQAIIEQVSKELEEAKEQLVEDAKQEEPEIPASVFATPEVVKIAKEKPKKEDIVPPSLRKELDYIKKSITDFHRFAQRHSQMGGGGAVRLRDQDDVRITNPTDTQVLTYDEVTGKWINADATGGSGAQGAQGYQGNDGSPGGAQGVQGAQGYQGVQGAAGVQGAVGAQGSQGVQGAIGAQGVQGATGSGSQGAQGVQGATGTQGVQGAQGVQGDAGAQGSVGNQGVQGAQGRQGAQGVQGSTGQTGAGGTIANYGAFHDNFRQVVAAENTPLPMYLRTTDEATNVSIVSNTQITVAEAGTYNLQFSAQLHNLGGGGSGHTVNIWLRKNNVNLPDSDTRVDVITNSPYVVAAWNWVYTLAQGDYLEIIWSSDNVNLVIDQIAAGGQSPGVPSVIATMTQVTYTQVGPQGYQGVQGSVGSQGVQGAQGVQGVLGAQGSTGSQGVQGAQGRQGAQGVQGATGTVTLGPAFAAYAQGVQQTIPTDLQTKVLFQAEEFDTNNNYANSTFTPTVAGYYQLNAEVRFSGASGTGEMMIVIWKNGSEIKRGWNSKDVALSTGSWWSMQVSSIVYANGTGDYFEIAVQHGAGVSKDLTAVNNPSITWFNGCLLRPA